jgi:predicted DNA-binding transcriptional regulator
MSATSAVDALSQMWRAVEQARKTSDLAASYIRPINGFTANEYSERYGVPSRTARDHVLCLFREGIVNRFLVILPNEAGAMHRTWVYVLKERS